MTVEKLQKLDVADISAIEITCEHCKVAVSLTLGARYPSLGQECMCPACKEPLWTGNGDTNFAQAIIRATGRESLNRFKLVVRTET